MERVGHAYCASQRLEKLGETCEPCRHRKAKAPEGRPLEPLQRVAVDKQQTRRQRRQILVARGKEALDSAIVYARRRLYCSFPVASHGRTELGRQRLPRHPRIHLLKKIMLVDRGDAKKNPLPCIRLSLRPNADEDAQRPAQTPDVL